MILTASRRDFLQTLQLLLIRRDGWRTRFVVVFFKNEEHNIIKIEEELNIGNMWGFQPILHIGRKQHVMVCNNPANINAPGPI